MSKQKQVSEIANHPLPDLEQHDRLIEQAYKNYTDTIRKHAAGEVDGRTLRAVQDKLRKAREDREYAAVLSEQILQAREERNAYQEDMDRADRMKRASASAQQAADLAEGLSKQLAQIQDDMKKLSNAVGDAQRTYPKAPDQHSLLGGPMFSIEINEASQELGTVADRFSKMMSKAREAAVTADSDAKAILKRHGERPSRAAGKANSGQTNSGQTNGDQTHSDQEPGNPEEVVIDNEHL